VSTELPRRPVRPLYSLHGIVIGTLLGSVLAGTYMVMHNYIVLGYVGLVRHTIIGGLLLFGITIAVSWIVPANILGILIYAIGQAGLAYLLARRLQGAGISYYVANGGSTHSILRAVLIGVATGFVMLFALGLVEFIARIFS